MPGQSPFPIILSETEKSRLEATARKYTAPYIEVVRAKIVLYAARGLQNTEIAKRLEVPLRIVSKWRKRFCTERLAGLEDHPRSGRPGRFSPRGGGRGQGDGLRVAP